VTVTTILTQASKRKARERESKEIHIHKEVKSRNRLLISDESTCSVLKQLHTPSEPTKKEFVP